MVEKSKLDTRTEPGSPLDNYLRIIITQIMVSMVRSLRDDQLTTQQLAALHLLDLHQKMRIGELAERLLMPMPAASRMTSEMVARGLLERHEDVADRRAKTVALTAAGRELMAAINQRRTEDAMAALVEMETSIGKKMVGFLGELVDTGMTRVGDSEH